MASPLHSEGAALARLRLLVRGAVQGVGFRPFIFHLAGQLSLAGWVQNTTEGVRIEAEGKVDDLRRFLTRMQDEKPPASVLQGIESTWLDPKGFSGFEILPSDERGIKTALVLPDIATCPECLADIRDPANRRYRYPFTNCTHCGPRFTIIRRLPYDRAGTSMAQFVMCPQCQAEYDNPQDRRFHAQPNACPECGPQLALWDAHGNVLVTGDDALRRAAEAVLDGRILAVKGLGGFHLVTRAGDEQAVRRLRERKHREEKPLAVMFPTLDSISSVCEISDAESRLLRSPEAPIVLLRRKPREADNSAVAPSVAPGNPALGVMLPYTPFHHLLLGDVGLPIVATSGNVSDEPICIDEREAIERLGAMADLFLVHNRPIVRHVDDSVARVMLGRELVLRRARGYAPMPVFLREPIEPMLAVGAHLKNAVCLGTGTRVFISQHIGDLESAASYEAFTRVLDDFQQLYETRPKAVAADLHPDYLSTQYARQSGLEVRGVQHHHAHVLACLAENDLEPPVLGVSWDGTGLGLDDTIWGGEFLGIRPDFSFERVASFRPFRLPGGDQAVKEPARVALGLLYALWGDAVFEQADLAPVRAFEVVALRNFQTMLRRGFNAPLTTSAGRIFDAVASIAGMRHRMRFEGQAAMELEFAASSCPDAAPYRIDIVPGSGGPPQSAPQWVLDWGPMVEELVCDVRACLDTREIALKFHEGLACAIGELAVKASAAKVLLTGGCFQNRLLAERTVAQLERRGIKSYWHQRVPPNDGGIALGQVIAAARRQGRRSI